MYNISISPEFTSKWKEIKLGCIQAEVEMVEFVPELWEEINQTCKHIYSSLKTEQISQHPSISSSRKAYKATGKDPARYRLSAEALLRRVVKGNELYQINNVVDIINLASIHSGFSIGAYDIEKISGNAVLGIGHESEPYTAIGRGELNISGLPVLRDNQGAFGSPTSDSERTSITIDSTKILILYFGFGNHQQIENELFYASNLLVMFANAKITERKIVNS